MIEKKCIDCLTTKPIAEFYPYDLTYKGKVKTYYRSWCRLCDSARSLARRRANGIGPRIYVKKEKPPKNPNTSKRRSSEGTESMYGPIGFSSINSNATFYLDKALKNPSKLCNLGHKYIGKTCLPCKYAFPSSIGIYNTIII